ncbi:hypothetical protein EV213_108167 [Aureibacillus halotolerans]|uniref:Uncharacterized protein n=1 Tax=Aureibacillus halotolerans TaxID=1508390 RepID=A0A4R6U452_9BACI|nr:hypothetical protein EV213_108167 [Aureibacillus halotolerans]
MPIEYHLIYWAAAAVSCLVSVAIHAKGGWSR